MNRNARIYLLVLGAAFSGMWLASPGIVLPPTVGDALRSERVVFATGSVLTNSATDALARPERTSVALPSTVELAASLPITFRMIGAPAAQLHGVASVRRNDDSMVEQAFVAGCLAIRDRATLNSVALRVSGFAIAWPRWDTSSDEIEVSMQRAGLIRVRLVDDSGALLANRCVWCMCQRSEVASPGHYQGNGRAVTDAAGMATIENLVPGSYDLGAGRVAEWCAVKLEGAIVTSDCVTTCDLVAPTLAPTEYGGFHFPVPSSSDATFVRGCDNTVNRWGFATDLGCYMINHIGDQVRCIARGQEGQQITGHIVALDDDGKLRPDLRHSAPITIAIGAVLPWWPEWEH